MSLHPFFQVGQDQSGVYSRQLEYAALVAVFQCRLLDELPGICFDVPGGIIM